LFEFFLNDDLYDRLTYKIKYDQSDPLLRCKKIIDGFRILGYDYATIHGSEFRIKTNRHKESNKASISLNDGYLIYDWESFEKYDWPNVDDFDFSRLDKLLEYLPNGMKLIICGPDGIFENVIALVGYENLCFMLIDEPELAKKIFNEVGSRFLRYYEICSKYNSVGAVISNDDWGFNTQTLLSVNDMRKYIIPWHKELVKVVHNSGKPVILHSCGKLDAIMDDIIDDIKYDAKHSYEDKIRPVEEAYEKYGDRIAILGGLDLDFIIRSTPEQVYNRAAAMLERTNLRGGYALGSGNSIPEYVPVENYLSMIAAAVM
jgi:uroporphyrinogen decarboxylase